MLPVFIRFAKSAFHDLEDVQLRNAEQGVPDVGLMLVSEVFLRAQMLADHTDMGRAVPEFGQSFLQEVIHPPFRVVYWRDPRKVRIVRICRSEICCNPRR